jgi:hypothetical protein
MGAALAGARSRGHFASHRPAWTRPGRPCGVWWGDPSPATALQELMASAPEREAAQRAGSGARRRRECGGAAASPDLPGSDTWPRAIHARLAYEALIRGFAPVEAIRQIQFGGVKGAVATAVGWLYSTKVQLAGVAALAFAAIAGLLARTGPTGASPVDGLYPCNLPVPQLAMCGPCCCRLRSPSCQRCC